MSSKYTSALHDRQIDAINKLTDFMNYEETPFYYKNLRKVAKSVNLIVDRIKMDSTEFFPILIALIRVSYRNFIKEKTSDEINFVPYTKDFINSICNVLSICQTMKDVYPRQMQDLFVLTINFLNEFVSFGVEEYKNQDSCFVISRLSPQKSIWNQFLPCESASDERYPQLSPHIAIQSPWNTRPYHY